MEPRMNARRYDVAAYIWPSYHHEPRMADVWPEGDGEWYTVRRGTPRFPGHDMPRVPLLGCQDEADPAVMRQQVALGAAYGVNTFIVDWYWFEQQACFERQLNEALLPALEGSQSWFYLMWANHEATSLWNMHTDAQEPRWTSRVDRRAFEPMAERLLERYLGHPRCYRIDGRPVLCIYEVANFAAGLGGLAAAADALAWLRQRAAARGLPGLHLQAINTTWVTLDGLPWAEVVRRLGFDSVTDYQFVHHAPGKGDYVTWAQQSWSQWDAWAKAYPCWFPHVSVGWDNTQRNPSLAEAVTGATPQAFAACLHRAKAFLDAHPRQAPLVTLNSWNEWTEGSYLLPDMRWGYGYLEAVREVFGAA
jgi:hypothetical protein